MAWEIGPESDSIGGLNVTIGMVTAADFEAQRARIEASLKGLEAHYGLVGKSAATATTSIEAGMGRIGKATNMGGYRLQVFAQTLDDLQYVGQMGLRPILNNIMQMSPALGIAAIGIDQVVQRLGGWSKLIDKMGMTSPVETAAEEMKRLGDLTERTANEQDRLNRLRGETAAIEQMRGGGSKAEKTVAGAVQSLIAEGDFGKVRDAVMEARRKEGLGPKMSPEDVEALRREQAFINMRPTFGDPLMLKAQAGQAANLAQGYGPNARETIDARLSREANAAAEGLLGQATLPGAAGIAARKQLEKYAREVPNFPISSERIKDAGNAAAAAYNQAIDQQTNEMRDYALKERARDPDIDYRAAATEYRAEEERQLGRLREGIPRSDEDLRRIGGLAETLLPLEEEKDRREGLAAQDAAAIAADQATKDAFAQAREMQAGREIVEGRNAEEWDRFNRLQEIGQRIYEERNPIRSSMMMDAAQLNASVQQSITNDSPQRQMVRQLQQANASFDEIKRALQNFGPPVTRKRG